jgi:hypothetical protein
MQKQQDKCFTEADLDLYTPDVAISPSERSQIKARLRDWADMLFVRFLLYVQVCVRS